MILATVHSLLATRHQPGEVMRLGFVSAILPDYTLEQVFRFAHDSGFSGVELMCWPPGKSERRYAGVTHVDVTELSRDVIEKIQGLVTIQQVQISGLGYYPNLLSADPAEAEVAGTHLRKVIDAASALGIGVVNTFVGRDPSLSVNGNWPRFLEVWRPLIAHAESRNVKIGIENCPMLFTGDEWPGGKNLATAIRYRTKAGLAEPCIAEEQLRHAGDRRFRPPAGCARRIAQPLDHPAGKALRPAAAG